MKVSLKWLQEYVDTNFPLTDLANRLTLAGILAVIGKILLSVK